MNLCFVNIKLTDQIMQIDKHNHPLCIISSIFIQLPKQFVFITKSSVLITLLKNQHVIRIVGKRPTI